MKFLKILMLLLAAVSTNAMAKWVEISKSTSQDTLRTTITYVDTSTIRKSGNIVKMWVLLNDDTPFEFPKEMEQSAKEVERQLGHPMSFKQQYEFNCKEELLRMLFFIAYSEHMGEGDVIPTTIDNVSWQPVIPNTIGETMWKIACGNK